MASKTSRKSLKPENPTRASERLRKSSKTPQISDVNGNESTQVKLQPTIKEELNYSPQYSDPFGSHFHSKIPITQRPQLLWNSKAFKSKSYYQCQNFSYFSKFSDHLCHLNWSRPVGSYLESFKVEKIASPFDRRITALEWLPSYKVNTVASASKNGDMFLLSMDQSTDKSLSVEDVQLIYKGGGPGHYVGALKWDSVDQNSLYAANMNGSVEEYDIQVKKVTVIGGIPYPDHYKHWWTAIEESKDNRLILAGNTHGIVVAFDKRSFIPAWQYDFHRLAKVQHLEFSKVESWLLASSGNDKGAKLWDIRKLQPNQTSTNFIDKCPRADCLDEVKADRPVNIASFNFRGDLLMTSDQHHFIHVYQGPTWKEIVKICHPHRQFQHLTPIRASWHPLCDLIIIGRYPDPKLPESSANVPINDRTIDVYCGHTGEIVTQLFYPKVDYITTITKMNNYGSMLACASGSHLVVWTPKFPDQNKRDRVETGSDPDDSEDETDPNEDFKKKRKAKSTSTKKAAKKEKKKLAG